MALTEMEQLVTNEQSSWDLFRHLCERWDKLTVQTLCNLKPFKPKCISYCKNTFSTVFFSV